MPRILIVDDSATSRLSLQLAFKGVDDFTVTGSAINGEAALHYIRIQKPDIVTMDVWLGPDDGVEVTAQIMSSMPVPILIVTGATASDPTLSFRALSAGALDVFPKLPGHQDPRYAMLRNRLIQLVRTLAGVPVVARRARRVTPFPAAAVAPAPGTRATPFPAAAVAPAPGTRATPFPAAAVAPAPACNVPPQLVVIGASTGGPSALLALLKGLPAPYGLPIVIVQHVASGFCNALANWLANASGHRVVVCDRPLSLDRGVVYMAPNDYHLEVRRDHTAAPTHSTPINYQLPSIDETMESVARVYGAAAVGVLLTGMGRDGVKGMQALAARQARTVAQSPASCVVDSMPRTAIEQGAVQSIADPEQIARMLRGFIV
jgi:two-component system chemotaxis response regulator CheB